MDFNYRDICDSFIQDSHPIITAIISHHHNHARKNCTYKFLLVRKFLKYKNTAKKKSILGQTEGWSSFANRLHLLLIVIQPFLLPFVSKKVVNKSQTLAWDPCPTRRAGSLKLKMWVLLILPSNFSVWFLVFHFILNEPAHCFEETQRLLKTQQDLVNYLVNIPWSKQITQQIFPIEISRFFLSFSLIASISIELIVWSMLSFFSYFQVSCPKGCEMCFDYSLAKKSCPLMLAIKYVLIWILNIRTTLVQHSESYRSRKWRQQAPLLLPASGTQRLISHYLCTWRSHQAIMANSYLWTSPLWNLPIPLGNLQFWL